NLAEALLLTRWLRPGAWLVTTGGASSAEEQPYAERLAAAARAHGWPLRLGVLAGDESAKPWLPGIPTINCLVCWRWMMPTLGFLNQAKECVAPPAKPR
ncbi:MAG: hypothetical protein K6T55_12720, partial [Syntrophobacterales bacterium]|nr:hypothetical protein [Syntrophobacterales bacterium]